MKKCDGPKSGPRKCRRHRPHCRFCRRPFLCDCGAYGYKHRKGGGRCRPDRMAEHVYGPDPSKKVAVGGGYF